MTFFQPVRDLFDAENFMPHGHCFLWRPDILWLHVISDATIAGAYYAIPLALLYFVRNRRDLPYKMLFVLFSAFIWLCGTTHIMGIWVLWHPDYAAEGMVKAATAVVSVVAFVVTARLIPLALQLASPAEIARVKLAAQLQRSEAMLRAVVENTLDGLITIDAKGTVKSFNPACERIFGYKTEEVVGHNVKMLMPDSYGAGHDEYISRYLRTGEAHIIGTAGRELEGRCKDGRVFPMDLSISTFILDDGQYFSGIVRDITGRKAAETSLLHYTRDLERSNQELDEFAHIASHDLKEPLRGLQHQAAFLKEDYGGQLDEPAHKRLDRITFLTRRMEQLVTDLLYFSQLGRSQLAVQPTNPNEIVEEIRQMLAPMLSENNVQIAVPRVMPVITCDKPRMTEVFRNLITNAAKYNNKPRKDIEIGFLDSVDGPAGKETDVFYVKDNGIGIPSEHHEDIFRLFRRLHAPGPQDTGTGAGLTFVKKIIERSGGKVWLTSVPGEGSVFYFTVGKGKAA